LIGTILLFSLGKKYRTLPAWWDNKTAVVRCAWVLWMLYSFHEHAAKVRRKFSRNAAALFCLPLLLLLLIHSPCCC